MNQEVKNTLMPPSTTKKKKEQLMLLWLEANHHPNRVQWDTTSISITND